MIKNKRGSLLYVSYDGILEPLGRSQVLSYLKELSLDYEVNLITFEKKDDLSSGALEEIKEYCLSHEINWIYARYNARFLMLAPFINIVKGILYVVFVGLKYKCKVVHIRSYLPGVMAYPLIKVTCAKLIFDMRGFWADEKVDRLGWSKNGVAYSLLKRVERWLLLNSDYVVSLTNEAIGILKKDNSIGGSHMVIPTCVDRDLFKYIRRQDKGRIVLGHLGAIDSAYDIAPVLFFFKKLMEIADSEIIFIYRGEKDKIYNVCKEIGVPLSRVVVKSALREELPSMISDISIGCFYVKNNYSIKASMPTKIAEFLSCGKPIMCNGFNKDVCDLVENNRIGLIRDIGDAEAAVTASRDLINFLQDDSINERCVRVAESKMSLKEGVRRYRIIYDELFSEY